MARAFRLTVVSVALLAVGIFAGTASANHSWGGYHWARSANPFNILYSSNLSGVWPSYLNAAAQQWSLTSGSCNNASNPVRASVGPGHSSSRNCRPADGFVEVCNGNYGNNGWLGIAGIYLSGSHITRGYVKLNDTYFNTSTYNTPAWRQFVTSQETGHILGLDHQDTDFNNPDLLDACGRGSCMDYSADPSNNTTPNQHDYDELVTIYSHLDAAALTLPMGASVDVQDTENSAEWGQARKFADGKPIVYERDLGAGAKLVTFVIWAR